MERRAITKWKGFVTINYFLLPVLSCKCFLVGFKHVNEPSVPQHVQRKDHVFQALTLESTWDLNKNCIIVICHEVSISMPKSYNDMYTYKIVIQRNKVLVFILGQCKKLILKKISRRQKCMKNYPLLIYRLKYFFFSFSDYIINEAAKILRLLHIKDLRELQSQINYAIVAVQAITANPKTDSRLGKIGRS